MRRMNIYGYQLCLHLYFRSHRVIRISPFANRLSFDAPPAVQKLRCLANYEALRFSNPILDLGEALVARMKKLSADSGGKYMSVHLRFEQVSSLFWVCKRSTVIFPQLVLSSSRNYYLYLFCDLPSFLKITGYGCFLLLCI